MTWEVYRGYLVDRVECKVRGDGWSVRDAAGEFVLFHSRSKSLAKKVVDALLFNLEGPFPQPEQAGET